VLFLRWRWPEVLFPALAVTSGAVPDAGL